MTRASVMGGGPRSPVLACCSIQCHSRRFVLGACSFVSGLLRDLVRVPIGLLVLWRVSAGRPPRMLDEHLHEEAGLRIVLKPKVVVAHSVPRDGLGSVSLPWLLLEVSARCSVVGSSRAGALCCGSVSAHFARKLCWHGVLRPRFSHTAQYRKKEDATALKRASGAGGAQEAARVCGVPPE